MIHAQFHYLIDGFGRQVGVVDPTNVKTLEILDKAGRSIETRVTKLAGTTETLYRWTTREYDGAGRVRKETRKLFTNPIPLNADGTIPSAGITDIVTETTFDGALVDAMTALPSGATSSVRRSKSVR